MARASAHPAPAPAGVRPSEGWGVLHLFLRARRAGPRDAAGVMRAIARFTAAPPQQVIAFSVLGGKADLGLMALGPDLDALDVLAKEVLAGPVEAVGSFVSLTELSEYTSSEDDERARLAGEGVDDLEARLAAFRERMARYAEDRLHPRLPHRALIAFYPMSKSRRPDANWYALPFAERKALMQGHARVGRRYAGRILQLITGATGLDDWEWGVTLLADDPAAIKEIVYEMRFDEVSARYGEFGAFWTGLVMEPAAALARAGLDPGGRADGPAPADGRGAETRRP
jgi:hydrogen peroxide-dependent heme synthase